MLTSDQLGRYVRRLELSLTNAHYDLARRIINEAERESTAKLEPLTLDSPIAMAGLSARTITILERHNIHTVRDALRLTVSQLREIPGIGAGAVAEIQAAVRVRFDE